VETKHKFSSADHWPLMRPRVLDTNTKREMLPIEETAILTGCLEICRDSSVGIAIAGRPGFYSWHGKVFSLIHSVQTGSGAHPVSYTMGKGGDFRDG
jgi:hypothetical protein